MKSVFTALCSVHATCLMLLILEGLIWGQESMQPTVREDMLIRKSGYELRVSKNAFALTISRASEVVFETAQPGDAALSLDFVKDGKTEHVNKLVSVEEHAGSYVLDYATTRPGVSARVQIEPAENIIHFKSWILDGTAAPVPNLAVRLQPSGLWFGGGFQGWREPLVLPLNQATISTKWFLADGSTQGTPFWYSSKGVALWVRNPYDFRYSVNLEVSNKPDALLRIAMPAASELDFDVLLAPDIRQVLQRIVKQIGYPEKTPPADYFKLPIYTTWVEFKTEVSQQKVLEYARQIHDHQLPCGVIEIDDRWESRYGDLQFDAAKFPDPKAMVAELHKLGYRVTLWVHPFVATNSQSFQAHRQDGLLLRTRSGGPMLTRWWNGESAVWDVSHPGAAAEFRRRLQRLQADYGFDGFKFDGGDVNFMAVDSVPFQNITNAQYPDVYNREATSHFAYNETRVGVYSQPLGIVQRLIDKQSVWSNSNGLQSLILEAILTSLRGFPYLMPDMVGGNQYDHDVIDKELLIRWAQASALMPLLQFSWGPWHFDAEAVDQVREASELHIRFAPYIISLAENAPKTGEPILTPLWYYAPSDPNTYNIVDEYMIGNDVIVAPVLLKGATTRDVYLPAGNWRDCNSGELHKGGTWLKGYPAPLHVLPLFLNDSSPLARQASKHD